MSLEPDGLEALQELLRRNAEIDGVEAVRQLTGGASRQTYAVEAKSRSGSVDFVLQREVSAEPRLAGGMADEADLVTAARAAGVPAPVVVGTNRDGAERLGQSFFVTERVPGETIARRILRDDRFQRARAALPAQLGRALAALHTGVRPADVPWLEVTDELARYREVCDELDLVSPAFELGFRWLEGNRPGHSGQGGGAGSAAARTVVHGDFRLGNLIVDEDGLAAVIDWELGHLGDPMEDLGWLCVRAWRFGGPGPVAGVGQYEELFEAYESAAGTTVDRGAVRWWETLGTLKWGIMCGTQSNRHLSGDVPSVELAAIGPRVAEQEYDVLRLVHPEPSARAEADAAGRVVGADAAGRVVGADAAGRVVGADDAGDGSATDGRGFATGLAEGGGRPSAAELLDAVRDFLLGDVSVATEGRTRFHALVAANALATVGRDLALSAEIADRRERRLARLGHRSERALAAAIRSGELDDRLDAVAEVVMAGVVDRLAVNNPGWIEPLTS